MTARRVVTLGSRAVGAGAPVLVVAEAGVNHGGSIDVARRLIDAAALAGADAVKFQTFRAERVARATAPKARYQARDGSPSATQLEMLRHLELSKADHEVLAEHCRAHGVLFVSSPFDVEGVELLDALDVPFYKVGSGELTNWLLLDRIAATGRPIVLSTGMSYLDEVDRTMHFLWGRGQEAIVLMHCTSAYPARAADANLHAIGTLAEAFGTPVGYSDHSPGIAVSLAAVALGAAIVEKHLTLDRAAEGPDHAASVEPGDLAELVAGVRTVEQALGDGKKAPVVAEEEMRLVARRGLVAARDLSVGEVIDMRALDALRPAIGIAADELEQVTGRRLARGLAAGEAIGWEDLE